MKTLFGILTLAFATQAMSAESAVQQNCGLANAPDGRVECVLRHGQVDRTARLQDVINMKDVDQAVGVRFLPSGEIRLIGEKEAQKSK